MKQSLRLCLPLVASFVLVACGGDTAGDTAKLESPATDGAKSVTASSDAGASSGPYKVKSGIVESTVDMMGEQAQTIYFDDYGAKQTIVTDVEVMGHKSQTISITADGWSITYDPAKKEGTKVKVPAGAAAAGGLPNLAQFTDEMKKEYKVTELDSRTIAGKEAVGISMEAMGMPMKVWTWEGIPLRTEVEMGGKAPMVTEVKSLQVDVNVPADKFVVPADVKITEM